MGYTLGHMKTAVRPATSVGAAWVLQRCHSYWLLSKPRITVLVWLTTLAGLVLGGWGQSLPLGLIGATLIGSWLVVASANAYNQTLEWEYDARMSRTAARPIPSGAVSVAEGWIVATMWGVLGVAVLALWVNSLAAWLGALSIVLYAFVYTPLKRKTHLCTAIGGIPGAISPLAGWAAAQGTITPEALLLFTIQYLWQFPHFWAIAWMNLDDYSRVGFRMLPYASADGKATARLTLWYTLALVLFSLTMALYVANPPAYVGMAVLLGLWYLRLSWRFYQNPERQTARSVLMASVLYLPVLLVSIILTR